MEESINKLDQARQLMKKGFRSPEQVRIQESDVARTKLQYESSLLELKVKENYEYKRKTTEFSAKAEQAKKKVEQAVATAKAQMSKALSEYEAAQATADIEQQQFKEFLKQKDKTTILAAQEGIVAYANESWYDSSRQIREGATVYPRQKIFSLPDMSKMQVKVNIHESLIKKIKVGQKAEIRIESFPSIMFTRLRHEGLATGRFHAPLDVRWCQAIPHHRHARQPASPGREARNDGRGQGHGR